MTTTRGVTVAEELARNKGLDDRIDVFEVEQFETDPSLKIEIRS